MKGIAEGVWLAPGGAGLDALNGLSRVNIALTLLSCPLEVGRDGLGSLDLSRLNRALRNPTTNRLREVGGLGLLDDLPRDFSFLRFGILSAIPVAQPYA